MDQNNQNIVKSKLQCYFEFFGQFTIRCMHTVFFKNGVDDLEVEHKTW